MLQVRAMRILAHTKKQVIILTIVLTLIAVTVPALVVGIAMLSIPGMPMGAIAFGVTLAVAIPLLITPPIAYIGLSLVRLLHDTIIRVDEHVKFDPLTKVLSRMHFLNSVRGRGATGVLMILDVDHFKRVNDSYGHAAGDQVLTVIAHALDKVVGPNCFVGRLGGEEFGIFLPNTTFVAGHAKAREICAAIRSLDIMVEERVLTVTVSIGCVVHAPETTIGHSLKQADELLYAAKTHGRDCVMPPLDQATPNRSRISR